MGCAWLLGVGNCLPCGGVGVLPCRQRGLQTPQPNLDVHFVRSACRHHCRACVAIGQTRGVRLTQYHLRRNLHCRKLCVVLRQVLLIAAGWFNHVCQHVAAYDVRLHVRSSPRRDCRYGVRHVAICAIAAIL